MENVLMPEGSPGERGAGYLERQHSLGHARVAEARAGSKKTTQAFGIHRLNSHSTLLQGNHCDPLLPEAGFPGTGTTIMLGILDMEAPTPGRERGQSRHLSNNEVLK